MKRFRWMMLVMVFLLLISGCSSQMSQDDYTPIAGLDMQEKVTLKFVIKFETDPALDAVVNEFMKRYPNVNIQTEYIENYDDNAKKLMERNAVDVIFLRGLEYSTHTITNEETGENEIVSTDDYYYNFAQDPEIDFSETTSKLMRNYSRTRIDENNNEINYLYCVPIGGEVRGLFVNKSLLSSVGKTVPTNWSEFLDCCEALKQKGYVPIQGSPATAGLALSVAGCVNDVVHNQESLTMMRNAEEGVSQLFENQLSRLYILATKRYYDYKYVEEVYNQFKGASDIVQAQSFLGLVRNNDTYEYETPENNIGTVGFFPYLSYLSVVINKMIDDYQLDTEFSFIITPMSDDENSPAYITPYLGMCANKNSEHLDWIREFVNFFFQTEINTLYAQNAGIIPNNTNAISYLAQKYQINEETACAICGDIFFSEDYNGFNPLSVAITSTSKCSAQKYMVALKKDADGNIVYEKDEDGKEFLLTDNNDSSVRIYKEFIGEEDPSRPGYAFCNLDYFLNQLENEFSKDRSKEDEKEITG